MLENPDFDLEAYRAAQAAFEASNLTPQEVADLADLHINTVKKVLKDEYVHSNSITKLIRALSKTERFRGDTIVQFNSDNTPLQLESFANSFSNFASRIDEFVVSSKKNRKKLLKLDVEELWIDLDRIEGSLRTIDALQRRHKNRKRL